MPGLRFRFPGSTWAHTRCTGGTVSACSYRVLSVPGSHKAVTSRLVKPEHQGADNETAPVRRPSEKVLPASIGRRLFIRQSALECFDLRIAQSCVNITLVSQALEILECLIGLAVLYKPAGRLDGERYEEQKHHCRDDLPFVVSWNSLGDVQDWLTLPQESSSPFGASPWQMTGTCLHPTHLRE